MAGTVKESLKEKIDRLRRKIKHRKTYGEAKIPGVEKPKKHPSRAKEKPPEYVPPKKDKTVSVGPRGGKFVVSSGGKKQYAHMNKSMIEEFVESEKFGDFIKSFKAKKEN